MGHSAQPVEHSPRSGDGPGVERTAMLTDAVVAIAMTLLVLPLVEASREVNARDVGAFFTERRDLFISFVVSFLVIYVFWAAHGSAIRRVLDAGSDPPALRPLTMAWLLVIAFLPFPTAVVGRELTTATAPLYIGTMLVLSVLTSSVVTVADRRVPGWGRTVWAWATTAVFAVCTLISLASADAGLFALLALAVLRAVEVGIGRRGAREAALPPDPALTPPPVSDSDPDPSPEGAAR